MGVSFKHQLLITFIIILMFVFVPLYLFDSRSTAILLILFVVILMLAFQEKGGSSILILALSFCFPYSGNLGESDLLLLSNAMRLPFNVIRLSILLIFGYYLFRIKKQSILPQNVFKVFGVFVFISLLYALNNTNSSEIISIISWFIYTYCAFYIAYVDRVSLKQFFYFIDVIFYLTLIYVIAEFIFHNSPYQFLYESYIHIGEIARAKGLLGHPLVLSAFLCFYQVALYAKLMIFKKINFVNFLLLLLTGLMTSSRTTIVLFIIGFVLYFYYSGIYKNIKQYFIILFVLGGIFIIIELYFNVYLSNTLYRIENGNSDQRMGAYSIVGQFFLDHPLGVGRTAFRSVVQNGDYSALGYDKNFFVLDNMYLTLLGNYGIFSIIYLFLYLYPLHFLKIYIIKTTNRIYSVLIILYAIWFFQNFSFDTNVYLPINLFFFMFLAFIGKELKIRAIRSVSYECIKYNNSQL